MDRVDTVGLVIGTLCAMVGAGGAIALWLRSRHRPGEPVHPWLWPQVWWPLPLGAHFLVSALQDHVGGAWSDVLQYVQYAAWAAMLALAWWWVREFRAHRRTLRSASRR